MMSSGKRFGTNCAVFCHYFLLKFHLYVIKYHCIGIKTNRFQSFFYELQRKMGNPDETGWNKLPPHADRNYPKSGGIRYHRVSASGQKKKSAGPGRFSVSIKFFHCNSNKKQ